MKTPIIIIGAGRTGRFTLDICMELKLEVAGFIADGERRSICGIPIIQSYQSILNGEIDKNVQYALSIGTPEEKFELLESLQANGAQLATIIHPNTVISPFATIEDGVIINAFSSVLNGAKVSAGALIEDHCGIGVDVSIGSCTTVAPGSYFNASSSAGDRCFIGSGVTVNPECMIESDSLIGASAAVTNKIPENSVAAGVPAKVLRSNRI